MLKENAEVVAGGIVKDSRKRAPEKPWNAVDLKVAILMHYIDSRQEAESAFIDCCIIATAGATQPSYEPAI